MLGDKNRKIKYDEMTNYYELCEECLAAAMAWEENGRQGKCPEICQGCPFEEEEGR